jgi:hypothetical protein
LEGINANHALTVIVSLLFPKFFIVDCLVFFSHPFCLSGADIIVLDYIIKGKLISKLEENETVSLKFSKKLESVTTKQVSKDYNNLNPFSHVNDVVLYESSQWKWVE